MSLELMNKAWKTSFNGNDLLILLSLADNASDEGYCFPSWKTIIKKTKVSKATLSYTLNAFEHFEIIKRTHRKRENGSNASNEYIVNILDIDIKIFKSYKQKISSKKDQSSESELYHTVQNLNYPSSESELDPSSESELTIESSQYEPSIESFKKENKEKVFFPLVDELEKSEEINQSEKLILNGFIKYRKEIKKSIKTTGPLKLFLDELRKINAAGIDIKTAIKIMKDNEWQSIKLDWVQKLLNSDSSLALNVPAKKTFFEQTEEQKHEKQQSTLANIAKVRKLREEGLL
jgi:hypothetical protein